MSASDDLSIARELGAMTAHLSSIDGKVGELAAYQKAQNGRVGTLEAKVAVLVDARENDAQERQAMHERMKDLESRGRMWALGIGGPVVAALLGVLLTHA